MSRSDGRGDLPGAFKSEEIERRLDHIIRVGKVVETGYEQVTSNGTLQPRVRVLLDGEPSAWLPIASPRNGPNGEWDAFELEEQVVVVTPSGVTAAAFVWGTIPRAMFPVHPYAEVNPDRHLRWYLDGTTVLYDRAQHLWEVDNPNADGRHHFKVTGRSEIEQTNDRIYHRIENTWIEIVDGRITLSVNDATSITLTPGLALVDAAMTETTGSLYVAGGIGAGGSVTAGGGVAAAGAIAAGGPVNAVGPISSATLVTAPLIVENGGSLSSIVAAAVAAQLAAGVTGTGGGGGGA